MRKVLKSSYSGSIFRRMYYFSTQNGPICPNEFFFRKPVYKPSCYYSCLSTFQKSKSRYQCINEILTIKEY